MSDVMCIECGSLQTHRICNDCYDRKFARPEFEERVNSNKICLVHHKDRNVTCSLKPGHPGQHAAYGGHYVKMDNFILSWDPDVTDEEVEEAIESIKSVMNK